MAVRAVGSCQDVTERKYFEAQHLRAQRLESLGTLAGGIAHDLNNVLAPILTAIELLRMDEGSPERLETLATIEESARRGAEMVKQVLSFARGVEGERRPVSAATIVRDVEKLARESFPKNITVRIDAAPGLWAVVGDATQLHQVIMNLLVNARDAMPHGGTLTLSLANLELDEVDAGMNPESRPGAYLVLTVTDTGIGIPAHVQERLFEPFFTTKTLGHGTGLGLSTVHTIVRSHGGFVNVFSEPGLGARFTVYLPAVEGPAAVAEGVVAEPRHPRGSGELILVVDDEAAIRSIVRRTLERFGYRVVLAKDGAEGVSRYVEHRAEIAVVLTDMAMPVMDGPAMCVAIRAIDPGVRIIGSSGLTSGGELAKALGADALFIPKPYSSETLLTTLHGILHRDA